MRILANLFLGIAKAFASLSGRQISIIIDEHDFRIAWRKAKSTDNYAWKKLYKNGNIFFDGFANPIKILPPNSDSTEKQASSHILVDKADFIPSQKYATAMKHDLMRQAFDTRSSGLSMIEKLLIANIGAILLIGAILVVLLG